MTLLLTLLISQSAWAATYTITYGTQTGTFYDGNGNAVTSGWIKKWVSNEAGKPAVTLIASANNINAENGRMAPGSSQSCTYTLSVGSDYVITGFEMNCPTFGAQVTVTPTGESATVVAQGGTLVVSSHATSFVYSGNNSGRIQAGANDSGSFTITVQDVVKTINYGTSTGSYTATNNDRTWASAWKASGDYPVTLSTSSNNINVSTGYIYSGSGTCTYTITAPNGYVVTGYTISGTAQTSAQTLTPAAGGSATEFATSGTTTLTVTGLSTGTTSFTQSTPNKGIAISSFVITIAADPNYTDWTPSFANTCTFVRVGEKVSSITAASNKDDNTHWYLVTQVRGGESPMYDSSTGSTLQRAASSLTASAIDGTHLTDRYNYLVRFIETATEGVYKIQFANGNFVTSSLKTSTYQRDAGNYAFYNSNGGSGSYFGWNKDSNTGSKVDNNGAGNGLAFWGSGTVSGTSGNNVWYVYPVEISISSITSTSGLSNTKKYNIVNKRGMWAVGSGQTDVNSTDELSLAWSKNDTKQQFAFIYYDDDTDDSNDGYYLYSIGESKFAYANGTKLSLTPRSDGTKPSKVTFTASTNDNKYEAPVVVTVGGGMFGVSTGMSPDVYKYDVASDEGNAARILAVGSFNPTDALNTLQDLLHPTHTITYIVKDSEDNTIFTSDPVRVPLGVSVSAFPDEHKRNYFYTYGDITPVTITDESDSNTDIVVVATAKDNVLEYTANTTSPVYYNLNIRGKYLVSAVGSTPDVSLSDNSTPFNKVAAWAFIGNPYDGFKIINQQAGTDKFLTYTSVVTGGNSGNNNIQFVDKEDFTNQYWIIEANNGGFCLRMKENMNIYFHHQNVTGQSGYLRTCSVSEWSTVHNDAGSTLTFSSDEQVLVDLYNEMQYIYFGDKYGQYTNGMTGDLADDAIANSTIRSAGGMIAAQATATYEDLYNLLIYIQNNIKDGYSTLHTPSAGFYRLKNKATGKYLRGKTLTSWDTGTKAVFADGNNSEAATVIRLYEKDGDEKLYMYNQGYGFGWVSTATGGGVAWLTENPNKYVQWYHGNNASPAGDGELAFAICYGNGTGDYASHKYKGFYTADTDDDAVIAGEDFTVNAAQWEVEDATSVTVALHNGGDGKSYATFYAPFDVTFTGATAYTITRGASIEDVGCEAVTTAVENNFVPAGTPVVLINEDTPSPATSCTATIEGTVSEALSTENILSGTYLAMTVEDSEDLVFGKPADGDPGFYRFDPEALSKVLGANKAYIDRTVAAGIRAFVFDSVTTGLNKVNLDAAKENIYDMQGRRVAKVQNGLYIVNGKKVLVK